MGLIFHAVFDISFMWSVSLAIVTGWSRSQHSFPAENRSVILSQFAHKIKTSTKTNKTLPLNLPNLLYLPKTHPVIPAARTHNHQLEVPQNRIRRKTETGPTIAVASPPRAPDLPRALNPVTDVSFPVNQARFLSVRSKFSRTAHPN